VNVGTEVQTLEQAVVIFASSTFLQGPLYLLLLFQPSLHPLKRVA
jgi:hypothetical protein